MDKKNVYGEYTLLHWIELILRKNVVLPSYQRHFVWTEEKYNKFIGALKNGNFIPPVIIGAFEGDNIILDGQQRLTSILLAHLGYYPLPDVFKKRDLSRYVDSQDSDSTDGEDEEPIEWTFNVITAQENNKSKAAILSNSDLSKYKKLEDKYCLSDADLNNIFLGFSYVVPVGADAKQQQKFYSTVFRDINLQGVELMGQESRRALYYMDSELEQFFEPEVSLKLKLKQNSKIVVYDFVRALSFASQFNHDGNESGIAKKCRRQEQFEQYYENFINDVVMDADSEVFGKFSTVVGITNIENRINLLKTAIEALAITDLFTSIIEADTTWLGLIYYVYINGKSLDTSRVQDLKQRLTEKAEALKSDASHASSPNKVTFIRRRIKASIDIYSAYVV